jgi:integrase
LERLTAGGGPYWLAALHAIPGNKDGCTHKVNRALAGWAERNGVPPFTFYAARKTWASLARRAGVEKATIDECLCHIGDFPVADIYIERDWELLNAANRRAIALLRWDALGNPVAPSMTE